MPTMTEDRDEILQLLYRYCHAMDAGDGPAFAETFTETGVLDVPFFPDVCGRAELADLAANAGGTQHVAVDPVITVQGDRATIRSYVFVFTNNVITVSGLYTDDVERTPDGWRLAKKVFKNFGDIPADLQAAADAVAAKKQQTADQRAAASE